MRGLWREMLTLAERRRPFAVCTVVSADGSVPGKVGSIMIVTPEGRHAGTVGGAGLELKVTKLAQEALKTGRMGVHRFDLAKWKEGGLNSVCGGTVDISVQVHRPLPHLLLYGGGHCGKALADMAQTLDWDVSVVDLRPEYADPDRFPAALDVIATDPAAWTRTADLGPYTHAYLLGHSWEVDAAILAELLPRFQGTIGAIGSQAKRVNIEAELGRRGLATNDIERLVCPIGIDIEAESPEEIAVAIAAEIISTLRRSAAPPMEVRA